MVLSYQHLAQPLAGRPPLVGCPRLLIQYILIDTPYWTPFLHPQPEEVPWRGETDYDFWALKVLV